ncbi:hypothetical protein C8R45DRAFT_197581 [Mycena sanguinolenta]|nr:hypothetical protein C8R45DRAFT_197581 [Mycena sanguinolenta]
MNESVWKAWYGLVLIAESALIPLPVSLPVALEKHVRQNRPGGKRLQILGVLILTLEVAVVAIYNLPAAIYPDVAVIVG